MVGIMVHRLTETVSKAEVCLDEVIESACMKLLCFCFSFSSHKSIKFWAELIWNTQKVKPVWAFNSKELYKIRPS